MSQSEKVLEMWEEAIRIFIKEREKSKIIDLLSKRVPKKLPNDEKQGVNIQLEEALKKCSGVKDKDIEDIVNIKNIGKGKIEKIDFIIGQYNALIGLNPDLESILAISASYEEQKQEIQKQHKPGVWLDKYAEYASGVSFATHVAKLSHSSIKGASSFFVKSSPSNENMYLATSELIKPVIDSAIDNAAYTPVVSLLKLEVNGQSLASLLSKDPSPFSKLSLDQEKINQWKLKFSMALSTRAPASHSLAKQIYFPINESSLEYHLLCNVNSSSMAHMIFESTSKKKNDVQKKAFEKNKYQKDEISHYYGKAMLALTSMDSAKNVSPLHSKRGGKLPLFSSKAPTWQSQLTAPIYRKSLFGDFHNTNIKMDIDYLRDFLLRFGKLDLSIKDPKRMRHLERWVNTIIDEFLFYAGTIQNLPPGWSDRADIKLKPEHQYFLDPYRADENFLAARQSSNWQAVIRADFSRWLNNHLRGKDKQFTPQKEHTRLWSRLLEAPLREFMEPIEMEMKQATGESV